MPSPAHRILLFAVTQMVAFSAPLSAQVTVPRRVPVPVAAPRQEPATLTGVVRDVAGLPIANARVQVADLRRSINTRDDGTFALRALPSGDTLQVIVARIGYRPLHLEVTLVPGDNRLEVALEPIAQQLDAVRTSTEQTGVFGVVGDTAYEIVQDARVRLTAGGDAERLTNALGQFAFETVQPGANYLEVRKAGFKPRLISFMQPAKGGTKLAIWMTPLGPRDAEGKSEFENRTVTALYDFRARARYKNSGAAIITRDMLAKYGIGRRLSEALDGMPGSLTRGIQSRDVGRVIQDEIEVQGFTLQDFNADDVEMVELYPAGTDLASAIRTGSSMRRTTSMTSMSGSGARSATAGSVARVWLRR
jgi:hypothetical protein